MRIFYCYKYEKNIYVTEVVDAWLLTLDKDQKETQFCFQDFTNITYISENVPYEYALMWLRTLAENGYVNLENHIFKLEEDDE